MQRLPGEREGGHSRAAHLTLRIELDQLVHRQMVERDERRVAVFTFHACELSRLGGQERGVFWRQVGAKCSTDVHTQGAQSKVYITPCIERAKHAVLIDFHSRLRNKWQRTALSTQAGLAVWHWARMRQASNGVGSHSPPGHSYRQQGTRVPDGSSSARGRASPNEDMH